MGKATELAAALAVRVSSGSRTPESIQGLSARAWDRLKSVAEHKGDWEAARGYAAEASAAREFSINTCKQRHPDSIQAEHRSMLDCSTTVGDSENADSLAFSPSGDAISAIRLTRAESII